MMLHPDAPIYIAGHRGLVGSAIVRRLQAEGCTNLLLRTHAELDLTDSRASREFFEQERPEYVFLAAARVGGIVANNSYPADFIHDNLAIQSSVIHAAYLSGVKRLLFLGSSCIYPKLAPQPMRERDLLTGPLEPTNRAYALAKIAGVEMCWSYNRQHGTRYLAAMPTNLYGPGDNYHPTNSHVIPALLRKFHEGKLGNAPSVTVWGSGTPRREFLFSDDMADACVFLMKLPDSRFDALLGSDETVTGRFEPPLVNIGVGEDISIAELAALIARVVGYEGRILYDASKPDGTPRKLMDVGLLAAAGWRASTSLEGGLQQAYAEFVASGG
jgi:GDP-L-fucose synthase